MKKFLFILLLLFSLHADAQKPRVLFSLSDTVFQVGAIYTGCHVWHQEKPEMRPEDRPCLDSISRFIKDHPGILIEIGCHTDQRGSDTANARFSQNDASDIKRYLVSTGVSEYDLAAVGYGESQLLMNDARINQEPDKNKKEDLYAKNRRIEFKILRVPQPVFHFSDSSFFVGQVMFPFILHDLSKCSVRPQSYPMMDSIANFLLSHPNIKIEIAYNMDARGTEASNFKLAECRVNDVVFQLKNRNVPAEQIVPVSNGETKPIVQEAYINAIPSREGREELHRINRRTEIKIIQVSP